jgi:ribose transport system permease protein
VTAATGTFEEQRARPAEVARSWARNNAWSLGLIGLLAALLVFTRLIQPNYDADDVQRLAIGILPLAFAAVAQAIVVISGGIDLSIGSMMALTSVVGAVLMEDQPFEVTVAVVLGVLLLGILLGAINGTLIVVTRVPDIVVTLAMLFVWSGAALLVLRTPGGASAEWLRDLVRGPLLNEWVPRALVVLVVLVALVWLPLRRSRLGLSLFAIGSNSLAAYRSGVSVSRTKIAAYALTGFFAAAAGLSLTATTGNATPVPGPYTLLSVAAVVLGGVSLAGGRGGVFGPIIAVLILDLIRADLTFLRLDPNYAIVAQGIILVSVVMVGSLIQLRRNRA